MILHGLDKVHVHCTDHAEIAQIFAVGIIWQIFGGKYIKYLIIIFYTLEPRHDLF